MKRSLSVIPLVTEIQRFCLQDGPGIRTTVFFKGCPLHCPWCHNPETQKKQMEVYFYPDLCTQCGRCVEVCPTGASVIEPGPKGISRIRLDREKCTGCMKCVDACLSAARAKVGNVLSFDDILKECLSDRLFFNRSGGGVTLSGGDPLVFPEFSLELAGSIKSQGIHMAMETSAFADWKIIQQLLGAIDLFIVDIKSMNAQKHRKTVGWPLEPILQNILKLVEADAKVRIHLPIIPDFNDSEADYRAFLEFLSPLGSRLAGVDVLPFHMYGAAKYTFLGREYRYRDIQNKQNHEVLPFAQAIAAAGILNVSVGGLVGMGKECSQENLIKEVETPKKTSNYTR